jgi:hypothetical protein
MNVTDEELEQYLAGKLRLATSRKTGAVRFLPAKKRPYDVGYTSPTKRAYWRVWYLRRKLGLPKGPTIREVAPPKAQSAATRKAYQKRYNIEYRRKHKARLAAYDRQRYLAKHPNTRPRVKKPSLLKRIFGWF